MNVSCTKTISDSQQCLMPLHLYQDQEHWRQLPCSLQGNSRTFPVVGPLGLTGKGRCSNLSLAIYSLELKPRDSNLDLETAFQIIRPMPKYRGGDLR